MKRDHRWLAVVLLIVCLQLSACGKAEEAQVDEDKPVTVEHLSGVEPTRLVLTEDAARRIDIQTAEVSEEQAGRSQLVQGEIIAAQDLTSLVIAPSSGTVLSPAKAGIAVTGAQPSTANVQFRLSPISALTAGSAEESALSMDVPEGKVLLQTLVSPGQFVEAGQPLFEVADLSRVWVQVQMTEAEFNRVDGKAGAHVLLLEGNGSDAGLEAVPVTESEADEVDQADDAKDPEFALYYSVENQDHALSLGQPVHVRLAMSGNGGSHLMIPYSAIIYDTTGNTWVYTASGAQTFMRTPVSVDYIEGGQAFLQAGPPAGSMVVTSGAEELYGSETEFEEE
ncbi:MAG TPA: HlyD family efflux transporter periplasmic adaptor subunit [Anaerolineales bacterium]